MVTTNELYWLAGLWEGEGAFSSRPGLQPGYSPSLQLHLKMTDLDVMQKAARLMKVKLHGPYQRSTGKPFWVIQIYSTRAAEWMMTLYTLLGARRQQRIKEILAAWRGTIDGRKRAR